ncbi:MAG: SurA N-terminal domain-containing protein [Candidatus Binatia bacterium]
MLKFIRRNAEAAWVKFIFLAIVIVFIFWGMGGIVGGEKAQFVARVNKNAIPPSDFYRAYNNLLRLYQDIYKDNFKPELMKAIDLKGKAVDQLIRVNLMRQEARRLGLSVGESEVRDAIAGMAPFQQDGRFSKDLYLRVLRANRITPGEFEDSKQDELLVDRLQNLIGAGVHVSEAEVRERYRFENEKVNLRFIKLDGSSFVQEVKLTDQDVQAYFDKNRETWREPERARVEYVLYGPDKFAGEVQISDADAKGYYDERVAEYEKPEQVHARHILLRYAPDANDQEKANVRKHAEEVMAKVKAGGDFAALAKQYSEDSSAAQGGDLGSFSRGKMVPSFEQAAFALAPGEISDLVESPFGLHIIKVEGKEEARTQTLDEVKSQIVAKLTQEKARDTARARAEAARAKVAAGEAMASVAQAAALSVATPSPFAQSEAIAGIGRVPEVVKTAFAAGAGDVGPVIDTPKGFLVFRVAEKLPSRLPELSEVRDRVESAARTERADALAKSTAEAALAELQKTPGIDAVAKAHKAKVDETEPFSRQVSAVPKVGMSPELKKDAFLLTPEKPVAPSVYAVTGSSIVAVLKERIPADDEKFNGEKDNLMKQAEERRKSEAMEQFSNYLIAHAAVERNDDFLATVADTGRELDGGGPRRR